MFEFFGEFLEIFFVLEIGLLSFLLLAAGVEGEVAFGCVVFHLLAADGAGVVEEGEGVGGDYLVDVLSPEGHAGLFAVLGAEFGGFEEDDDEAVEGVDLVFAEVVFGDEDVGFADLVALPGEQAKVRVVRVRAGGDEFGGGLSGDGVKEEVLDGGEELLGLGVGFVVVGAEGEEGRGLSGRNVSPRRGCRGCAPASRRNDPGGRRGS